MVQRLSDSNASTPVTAEQVRALAVDLLTTTWPLGIDGYRYTEADVFNVVVAAAAQQRSLDSVCRQLVGAPSANLVRQYLAERLFAETDLEAWEAACHGLVLDRLPADLLQQRLRVAIDLVLLPYYGKTGTEPDQLRRGEAKAGTTRFHCSATAYVIRDGRRVTLAVTFVWAAEALLDVLEDRLDRRRRLGVQFKRLYLDRQFASVTILRYLDRQPFTSVVALPRRGKRLKARLTGRAGYRTTYTMGSAEDGEVTFALWIACHYAAGRRGKHGREYQAFAVVGQPTCRLAVPQLAAEYRQRFGIESRFRQLNQVRARTTSRHPELRLLLVSVALLLTNLWVWLKAHLLASTARAHRRAARAWLDTWCRLDGWRDLLIEAIKALYGVRNTLHYPFPLAHPVKL